jgi:hypothetical protein
MEITIHYLDFWMLCQSVEKSRVSGFERLEVFAEVHD